MQSGKHVGWTRLLGQPISRRAGLRVGLVGVTALLAAVAAACSGGDDEEEDEEDD
jgi:hypothetical protein